MGGNPMELAKPKVIKIAETRLDRAGVHEMLESLGVSEKGEERFERMPDNGEALCELSGRMCYESFEIGLNPNVTKISQESLRYVRPKHIRMWLPEDLDPALRDAMIKVAERTEDAYRELEKSVPWNELPMDSKKRLTSALRRILFDGIATNVVWTANFRTLRWVIEMRTDPSAEAEIRLVFDRVAEICKRDYPLLFQDFERKELPDGTGSWRPTLRSKV